MMKLFKKAQTILARPKVKSLLLWLVAAYFAETFIQNGFRKFDPEGFWSNSFLNRWGFSLWFMYLIGVLEFISGLMLLIPKLRPLGSWIIAVVMFGALMTRSIYKITHGLPAEDYYNFFEDVLFFLSTIAIMLFFTTYRQAHQKSEIS